MHLDVALGFNNTFRLGHWAPVSVAVSNRGRDIAGHLELVVGRSVGSADDAEAIVHSRPLGLARDATKRLSFTVRLESFGTPLIARVRVGKAIIAEKRLPLRDHFTDARLVLVLSRDADLDYLNDGAGRRTRVLYPHPERLPHRWQGYDGVEAVIVHGVSLANLAPAQTRALRLWIEAGGTFVFSASPDYSNALERTLATLLPGVPSGSVRIRDLGDVGDGLGLPKAFERPFDVHQISRYRGQVLARAGNTPLIIEEARGKGRSIYLAFDVSRYPFQNWNGSRALLTKLLAFAAPPPVSVGAKDEVEHLAKDALRAGAVRFPSHMTLVVFVVVYLGVLLAGCTATFSSSLRLWLLPWFSWAAPVLFAPLAYLIFGPSLYPAGASAVVVSVIEPLSNSAKALLQVDIAIFANRAIPLRFEYDRVRPVWRRPDVAAGGDRTGWTIGGGAAAFVQPRAESPYRLFLLS
ncbi:MAG: hypothetical protein HOI95_15670, partial [Chromatiales bacterium]|nr:hypothetical protein [Chromatiales bacterium]